jgi:hypothetical protein
MTRKGEMSLVDEAEQKIRDNANYYSVAPFQPGSSTRSNMTFKRLDHAIKYCEVLLSEPNRYRSAMVYAVDETERFAMVGSMDRKLNWKPVVVDIA